MKDLALVAALLMLWIAPHAYAQGSHSSDEWFKQITVNGFASTAYEYNANRPRNGVDSYRVFDYDDNSFNLDVAEVVVQLPASKAKDFGFRVDMVGGNSIPRVSKVQDQTVNKLDLQQVIVSYIAPIGSGLRFDVGKYVTHLGYEVIEGYDGYNDNYSRSLLFGYAIPFTHTGAKASYAFNDKVGAMVEVVKGWDLLRDNNGAKTIGAQLALTPASALSLFLNWIGGPELPNDNHTRRNVFDFAGTLKPTTALTLGVNGDYGMEDGTSRVTPGADAIWKGIAGYAVYALTNQLSFALRAETMRDEGGTRFGTDTPADISEITLTPAYKVTSHVVLRGEVRHDWANQPILTRAATVSDRQSTAGINFIIVY